MSKHQLGNLCRACNKAADGIQFVVSHVCLFCLIQLMLTRSRVLGVGVCSGCRQHTGALYGFWWGTHYEVVWGLIGTSVTVFQGNS